MEALEIHATDALHMGIRPHWSELLEEEKNGNMQCDIDHQRINPVGLSNHITMG